MTQKKITFSSKNNSSFMKELHSLVNEYFDKKDISKFGNASLVLKSFILLSIYFTPYILMVTGVISNIWLITLGWMLMGIAIAGIGMGIMHDANHRSYSKNKLVNKFVSKSLYLLGGFPPTWRYQHNNLHHGFTNIEGKDDDIAPIGILRFSPHSKLKYVHKFQFIYAWFFYGLMTLSWVTNKDFKQLIEYSKKGAYLNSGKSLFSLLVDLTISKIVYYIIVLGIPIITMNYSWLTIILLFILMHFVAGFILGVIFQTAHVMPESQYSLPDSSGKIHHDFAVHQLLNTTNYSPNSKFFSWFIGGLNYQIEHHLFQSISHIHYKDISKIVRNTAKKYNIPYNVEPTFFSALLSHSKMLWKLGRI